MRRILTLVLTMSLIILSGCVSNVEKICYTCEESCSQDVKFCPNCGANLISSDDEFETEQEPIDYSDFGFQNNYGMNEWMEITKYDFSDPDNAFVTLEDSKSIFYIMKFENNYLHTRKFYYRLPHEANDFTKGELKDLYNYSIVSNEIISLPDSSSYEITEIDLQKNIPIIHIKLNYVEYFNDYAVDDGTFIPKEFIDFNREPEIFNKEYYTAFGNKSNTCVKYYIKSNYLN